MAANMSTLKEANFTTQDEPDQGVSALEIPTRLSSIGNVFLVGSPANHDPEGESLAGQFGGNIKLKEDVFYSMCWGTPPHTAVV